MRGFLAALLAALVAILAPHSALAENLTKFEKEGPCKTKITVPIEIYGSGANDEWAFEIQKNVRDQWAGPSAEDAATIGGSLGLEVDWYGFDENAAFSEQLARERGEYMEDRDGNKIDPKRNRDGTQELVDKAGQIRGVYADYVREFGADPACLQGECCAVKIVTDVKVRGADDDPTPGYYQIEIVDDPNFRSFVWADRKPREGIDNPDPNNPDHYELTPGQNGGSNGRWANNANRNAAAHEVGHLMGLTDQYQDIKNSDGETVGSFQQHGHRHDIMAQSRAFAFDDAISQLLEIGGIECDEDTCCPGFEFNRMGENYGLTARAIGDAISACDKPALQRLLRQLENQRRNLLLATNIPAQRRIPLAVAIDSKIKQVKKALEEECPRPVTGTPPPAISTGQDYTPGPGQTREREAVTIGVDTESSEWCEFGTDSPLDGKLIPGGSTPGTTPGSTPGTTPGSTPGSTPGTTPGMTPGSTPGTTPGTTPGSTPGTTPGGRPGITPGTTPGTTPGGRPGITPGSTPGSTPEDDDGDDPRDTDKPDDGDDPRDTDQPETPTTVNVKAKAAVLSGTGKTSDIAKQRIKLIPDATRNAALPTDPGASKDTNTGAGDDPAQCTTDNKGECKIDIARPNGLFGLKPGLSISPTYDLEVETPQNSGATVIGDTPLSDAAKARITSELGNFGLGAGDIKFNDYKIGDKWVTGIGYGVKLDYGTDWNVSLGGYGSYKIETDTCRTIQPGPSQGLADEDVDKGNGFIRAGIRGAVISLRVPAGGESVP